MYCKEYIYQQNWEQDTMQVDSIEIISLVIKYMFKVKNKSTTRLICWI